MAFSQSDGKKKFQEHTDKDYSGFIEACTTEEIAAQMWADVFDAIAQNVFPTSTTASAAKTAMKSALSGLSMPTSGLDVLVAACNLYATTLGTGMVGYAPIVVPFVSSDFGDPSLSAPGTTAEQAADLMASKIVAKLSQSTSFLLPFGPTVPWS